MCGICGIYQFGDRSVPEVKIESMMNAMLHRGPDDRDTYCNDNYGLGHVRLSIIDLSNKGRQPFTSDDGKYTIVFNGEIYNYLELKSELKDDFKFRTNTDTEVLLNAYIKWKEKCLHKLNGMFAFAIIDVESGDLFAARDRFGIKPFYYCRNKEGFSFASEIKPLLVNGAKKEVNHQIIYDFLVFNRVQHHSQTFFNSIEKLQHGCYIKIVSNEFSIKRWYNLKDELKNPFKTAEEFREALTHSTLLRMRSDVPVGAMLSGGLDSSSIVSIILKYSGKKDLNTFSAIYSKGMKEDESDFVSLYSSEIQKMHFTSPSGNDLYDDLTNFTNCLEEPVPGLSVFAEYKLMELCKGHVTVVLNGQGADEYLGGYHYFFGNLFLNLLQKGHLIKFAKEATSYISEHHSFYGLKALTYFSLPKKLRQRITSRQLSYLNKDFSKQYEDVQDFDDLYKSKNLKEAFINHFEYKFEHMLLWGDKTSMHHSLELRFPFLDHNLVERSIGMDDSLIINRGRTKHILREAMTGILPEKIRTRSDKIGFEVPYNNWFNQKSFNELCNELINSNIFKEMDYFDPRSVEKLMSSPNENPKELWKIINLSLWSKQLANIT